MQPLDGPRLSPPNSGTIHLHFTSASFGLLTLALLLGCDPVRLILDVRVEQPFGSATTPVGSTKYEVRTSNAIVRISSFGVS